MRFFNRVLLPWVGLTVLSATLVAFSIRAEVSDAPAGANQELEQMLESIPGRPDLEGLVGQPSEKEARDRLMLDPRNVETKGRVPAQAHPQMSMADFARHAKSVSDQVIADGRLEGVKRELNDEDIATARKLALDSQLRLATKLEEDGHSKEVADLMSGRDIERARAKPGPETVLMVSTGMPDGQLREALRYGESEGIPVIFRGLIPGTRNIPATAKAIRTLVKSAGIRREPMVAIDPLQFQDFGVTSVPVLIHRAGNRIGKIAGILNLDHLKHRMEADPREEGLLDFGVVGAVSPVKERDLIEMMKSRVAAVDWKAKQRRAIENFWHGQTMHSLPAAKETESWWIDPTVRVKKDITNAKGEVLAYAGTEGNPIKQFGLHIQYLILDPTDARQIQWVKGRLANIKGQFQVLLSEVDASKGWDGYRALREEIGVHLFMLPATAIQRFQLSALPAQVKTEENGYLRVTQFKLATEAL